MKRTTKTLIVIGLLVVLVGLFIKYGPDYLAIMKPAPPGIHGLYSLADYDPVYKIKYDKDSLLKHLETDGLLIKSGRLNDYDPPWDSLRYLIDNIRCDTQSIEPYIEFRREKQNGLTTFRILWINAAPNESYDTTLYQAMTKKYYNCFETILRRHEVQFE
jgi:hypothetical protein